MLTIKEAYFNHLEEIFETPIDYIYLHDKKGNILDVNEVVVKNLGYSKKEIQKMKVSDCLLEEISSKVFDEIKQTMETGEVNSPKIFRVKKKNGNSIYLEANTISLKKNGKFYAILVIGHDITRYIAIERKLKESEEKYYHLFNKSPYNISLFDINGNLVETNGTIIRKLAEYANIDFKGQNFIEIASHFANSKEIIQLLVNRFKDIREGKILEPIEFSIHTITGRKIWLHWQSSTVEINKKLFVQVMIRDITERKETEQRLKENARMQNCLNKIITLGNESTSLQEFLSKSYDEVLEIVGFDRGGVFLYNANTQHNILVHHKNVHPDFIAAVKDVNISKGSPAEIFDKIKPLYFEDFSEFMKDSKQLGIYSAIVVPLRSKDQYVGSMNIGSAVCQSLPQKELEILLAIGKQMGIIIQKFESEKLLMESEEQYRRISENANDLISIINNKFEFEYVNEKIHKSLVGYTKEELIGMNGILLIHPDDKNIVLHAMKNIIESGDGLVIARIKHKNGGYIWTEIKGKKFTDKENERKILMITRDISDRKEIESKLKAHAQKLEFLNEIIIGGTKASDLNSLLTNVLKISLEMLDFDAGGVYLIKEEINKAELIYHKDLPLDFVDLNQYVPIDKNPYKIIFKDIEPLFIEDYREIDPDVNKKWGFSTVASIPLTSKTNVIGALNITSKRRYQFSEEEKEIFKSIGRQIGTTIEKIQAEIELKESEEKFRVITEQSFMSIMVIQDGVFKYFNERLPKRLGYSAEEIKNWGPYEFAKVIHPDDKHFVLDQARKKQSGEEDVINNYIYRSIRKDGTIGWVENFSKTINYGGRPADLVMSIDITDKIEAEEILKESEEKFRTLAEQSFMGIVIVQDGVIKYFNEQAAMINGLTTEEMQNLKPYEFQNHIYPKDREFVMEQVKKKQVGDADVVTNYKYRVVKKNGDIIWVENYSKTILYKGKPADFVMTIDISDKIKAEQKLKESEEKFRNITEQSFMGILIIQEGNLKYLNKAIVEISGYSSEEILKWSTENITKMIHPEDLDNIVNRLERNIEGTMSPYSSNVFRIVNKNGEVKWLEDYTTRILYEGKPANLISIVDITEKRKAQELIIEENRRLLELSELRRDLITRVSHEIKTPITAIYGAIQMILKIHIKELNDEVLRYVEIGHRGCLRLKELVDNLLDVSRLEEKKFQLELRKENLVEIIIDCANDMKYLSSNRQLIMDLNLPHELYINIDKLRFRQVLTNLISNAIKNTPKEGKIVIDLTEEEKYIDVKIKDSGVGFTSKEKEMIFEKFGKIERYGMDLDVDIEGSGLGLFISKEIAELHGGQILMESEGRNKGSKFTIRLFKK